MPQIEKATSNFDRVFTALQRVEAERDEAVALAAVLRGELEKVWPLFGRIPLHLDTADEEVLAGVVFTLSHQQSTEFDHFMKSVRAALATPNEQVAALLRDAERGRRAGDREWLIQVLAREDINPNGPSDKDLADAIIAALNEEGAA